MNLERLAAVGQFPLFSRGSVPHGFNFKCLAVVYPLRCVSRPVLRVGGCFAAVEIDGQCAIAHPRSAAATTAATIAATTAATTTSHSTAAATDSATAADS